MEISTFFDSANSNSLSNELKSTTTKKTSYRASRRLPKARTKTGCFTCRKRKKKCDEKGPVCTGCSRNFLECVWPAYVTETLPKNFELSSCTNHTLDVNHTKEKLVHFGESIKKVAKTSIPSNDVTHSVTEKRDLDLKNEDDNIPSNLCSVLEIQSYKHQIPFPLKTTIPDTIDFIVDCSVNPSTSLNKSALHTASDTDQSVSSSESLRSFNIPSLNEAYVDHQLISEIFDSLYHNPDHLSPENVESSSPEDTEFYNNLLDYTPKTNIPSISIKNPVIAAFREIFFARGCSYLADNNDKKNNNENTNDSIKETSFKINNEISLKYRNASEKHYENAISIVSEHINPLQTKQNINLKHEHWSIFAIKTLCKADKTFGFITESSILNSINGSNNVDAISALNGIDKCATETCNKILFSQALTGYPFIIYFSKLDSLSEMMPPSKIFQTYNKDMIRVFLDECVESSDQDSSKWVENVIKTATINILETLTKLLWLLRMKDSVTVDQFNLNLKQLKTDISLIWTTIQTAEIQLELSNASIDFAKFSHMTLEILYLTISDQSVSASSPIVGFYLDQFMTTYESFLNHPDKEKKSIPKISLLLPLFIAACTAQTLQQKAFLSKELYLMARALDIKFIENLTMKIEDAWCLEQNGGDSAFSKLVSRHGFLDLVG